MSSGLFKIRPIWGRPRGLERQTQRNEGHTLWSVINLAIAPESKGGRGYGPMMSLGNNHRPPHSSSSGAGGTRSGHPARPPAERATMSLRSGHRSAWGSAAGPICCHGDAAADPA